MWFVVCCLRASGFSSRQTCSLDCKSATIKPSLHLLRGGVRRRRRLVDAGGNGMQTFRGGLCRRWAQAFGLFFRKFGIRRRTFSRICKFVKGKLRCSGEKFIPIRVCVFVFWWGRGLPDFQFQQQHQNQMNSLWIRWQVHTEMDNGQGGPGSLILFNFFQILLGGSGENFSRASGRCQHTGNSANDTANNRHSK